MEAYQKEIAERARQNIPPKPLSAPFCKHVCSALSSPETATPDLVELLFNRVSPGVDPAAKIKADFLGKVAKNEIVCPLIPPERAIEILGTMTGGYNVGVLVDLLNNLPETLVPGVAQAFKKLYMVYANEFDALATVARAGGVRGAAAMEVIQSWASAEWLTSTPPAPTQYCVKVVKVSGETTTDGLSPPTAATTRPDIPLHALSMGATAFPREAALIREFAAQLRASKSATGPQCVAFVGDVVGTGSSRKSACNSLVWEIGDDIPFIPNRRTGGVIIGSTVAPIFYETARDCGCIVVRGAAVSSIQSGQTITVDIARAVIVGEDGTEIPFTPPVNTLLAEHRVGGRLLLFMGKLLTARARQFLNITTPILDEMTDPQLRPCFEENIILAQGHGYTRAQKIVGQACGLPGVLPGSSVFPHMTSVASQDTTGPMTADEIASLACTQFNADLVMQSFCHTCAYPTATDIKTHKNLPSFFTQRGGIALRPGDGVVHSWINRMILPDTVGTGGDSHTRFPIGISFPAGSGMVAFAAAIGAMPLDLPPSVRVQFRGTLRPGITIRDLVNAITYSAIQQHKLTVSKENKINVFDGSIMEIEGLPDLSVEQAFELTNATAERSAAAACIDIGQENVVRYVLSCASLLEQMANEGYKSEPALRQRVAAMRAWAANPTLLHADPDAVYKDTVVVDLDSITEPLLACPNDPDDVRPLSAVQGTQITDVFMGSCMTNIAHFRAAEAIWNRKGVTFNPNLRLWLCPPTRMDQQTLREEAWFSNAKKVGGRVEMPGCSLCMGNQARVPADAIVFSTSTRNFPDRMGDRCRVYLGSAELASIVGVTGRIPTPEEYFSLYNECIEPKKATIYRYNYFHEMEGYPKW